MKIQVFNNGVTTNVKVTDNEGKTISNEMLSGGQEITIETSDVQIGEVVTNG